MKKLSPTDEIVVTGIYDKAVSLFELPASFDVLDKSRLQNISAVHPAEALNAVAGVAHLC